MTVVILEDAVADIELGRRFYESCEAGAGDYFVEAILADLDSLVIFAPAFTQFTLASIECCPGDFLSEFIMKLKKTTLMSMPFWICGVTLFGLAPS